jgi:hypothetical protein
VDSQVGGDHYSKYKIQVVDIVDDHNLDFYEGNILKYLLRYKDKNGVQDLYKLEHYLQMIIEKIESGGK